MIRVTRDFAPRRLTHCIGLGLLLCGLLGATEGLAQERMISKDEFLRQLGDQEQQAPTTPKAQGGAIHLRGPAGTRVAAQISGTAATLPAQAPAPAPVPTQAPTPVASQPAPTTPPSAQVAMPEPPVPAPAPQEQKPRFKEMAVTINFRSGTTALADDFSKRQLQEVGEALANPILLNAHIEIGGHSDGIGSAVYNLELSRRRAQAVKDVLCKKKRINCARFSVKGYGESMPVASNDNEEGRAKNRRVVFKRMD